MKSFDVSECTTATLDEYLVTGYHDGTVIIWNPDTLVKIKSLQLDTRVIVIKNDRLYCNSINSRDLSIKVSFSDMRHDINIVKWGYWKNYLHLYCR